MADEQPKPEPTPLPAGELHQRLVKAWRMSGPVTIPYRSGIEVGLYICPKTGVFYARVPEDDEGTLYTSTTRHDLRDQVSDALKELVAGLDDKEMQGRVWERCIRVHYKNGGKHVGEVIKGTPTSYIEGQRSRYWVRNATDAMPCTKLGVLTFSRYERSLQPNGQRYDEREWEEDFQVRLARWRAMKVGRVGLTQEEHRQVKPSRGRAVAWCGSRIASWAKKEIRVLPWSQDTWDRLNMLAGRFEQIDLALHKLLIEADQQTFLDGLAGVELPLLSGPT